MGSHVPEAWCLDGGEAWLDLMGGGGSFSLAGKHVKEGPAEGSLKVTEPSMFSSLSSGDICVTRPRTPTGAGSEETNPRR